MMKKEFLKSKKPDELIDLLQKVPGQYPDFVLCIITLVKNYQIGAEVKQFLMEHPEAKTDDIITYIYDHLIEE